MGLLYSINQLSEITGKDRRTISQRLSAIAYEEGPKQAHLYDSAIALEAIYAAGIDGVSLDEARKRQALSQAALNEVREEELRKTRIPIEIATSIFDEVTQAIAATLKAAKNKPLTEKLINQLFEKLRAIPEKLKW